jgi:hypothetical protein
MKTPELKTEVAGWIERILALDEERQPTPWLATSGMLVARVTERIAQASFALSAFHVEEEPEVEVRKLFETGAHLTGAAALALNGISHIHQGHGAPEPVECKAILTRKLDEQVVEMANYGGRPYEGFDPDLWLRLTMSLLVGACQGVCEEEEIFTPVIGDRLWEDEEECDPICLWEDEDEEEEETLGLLKRRPGRSAELRDEISDSLFQAAVVAAAAGQWFADQAEDWYTPEDQDIDEDGDDLSPISLEFDDDPFPITMPHSGLHQWSDYSEWTYSTDSSSSVAPTASVSFFVSRLHDYGRKLPRAGMEGKAAKTQSDVDDCQDNQSSPDQ